MSSKIIRNTNGDFANKEKQQYIHAVKNLELSYINT